MCAGEQADSRRQQEGSYLGGGQCHALHAAGLCCVIQGAVSEVALQGILHAPHNALPAVSVLVISIIWQIVESCLGRCSWQAMLSAALKGWSALHHAVSGVLGAGGRPQHQL